MWKGAKGCKNKGNHCLLYCSIALMFQLTSWSHCMCRQGKCLAKKQYLSLLFLLFPICKRGPVLNTKTKRNSKVKKDFKLEKCRMNFSKHGCTNHVFAPLIKEAEKLRFLGLRPFYCKLTKVLCTMSLLIILSIFTSEESPTFMLCSF